VSEAEATAHAAMIASMKGKAVWLKYEPAE